MPHADLMVAWLAAGEKAVISHDSALTLYGLSDLLPAEIHLTIPRTASYRVAGVRLHTGRLSAEEITRRNGLPVTTLSRTFADLIANGLPDELIDQAVRQALDRGLIDEVSLRQDVQKRGGRVAHIILLSLDHRKGT